MGRYPHLGPGAPSEERDGEAIRKRHGSYVG